MACLNVQIIQKCSPIEEVLSFGHLAVIISKFLKIVRVFRL